MNDSITEDFLSRALVWLALLAPLLTAAWGADLHTLLTFLN